MAKGIGRKSGIVRRLAAAVARWYDFERVYVFRQRGGGWEQSFEEPPGYDTRRTTSDEFHASLPDDLRNVDYRWAFARGDACMANFHQGTLVGWDFTAEGSTRVTDAVEFTIPDGYWYSYASFTHPDHRGRKLADTRAAAWVDDDPGEYYTLWYININNEASLSVFGEGADGVSQIGRAGYLHVFGFTWTWRSAECRRLGIGFRASSRR